jgi:hypothetical protein
MMTAMTRPTTPDRATAAAARRRRHMLVPLHRADAALLAATTIEWRKVAWIVGAVWMRLSPRHRTNAQLDVLARRVARLAAAGRLEAAGNPRRIRFSEVRLPRSRATK